MPRRSHALLSRGWLRQHLSCVMNISFHFVSYSCKENFGGSLFMLPSTSLYRSSRALKEYQCAYKRGLLTKGDDGSRQPLRGVSDMITRRQARNFRTQHLFSAIQYTQSGTENGEFPPPISWDTFPPERPSVLLTLPCCSSCCGHTT